MRFTHGAMTHEGGRRGNEDSHRADEGLAFYAVADGVGGRLGGAVASRIAVEVVHGFFKLAGPEADLGFDRAHDRRRSMAESRLAIAFRLAHKEVLRKAVGPLSGMGTTLAVLLLRGDKALLGHVGDSRVCRLRRGALAQLTSDHSLYAELAAAGVTDLTDRDSLLYGHMLTRGIGFDGSSRPDVTTLSVEAGDRFLLSTDGVTDALSTHDLETILSDNGPDLAAEEVVLAAIAAGTTDNVTALVVDAA